MIRLIATSLRATWWLAAWLAWRGGFANLVRLGAAVLLLWVVAGDTPARLARMQLAALPDFDYAAEVSYLRAAGRYGEALMVADAGLDATRDPAAAAAIEHERQLTVAEQQSVLRRAREVGMGAVSGRGQTIEGIIGAVAADFFIVGDVRDLVIEGGRYIVDGETDEVILILSGVGLATTVAPHVDWVPSLMKAARKTGTLTRGLADQLLALVRRGERDRLMTLFRDVGRLSERASPGGAMRMLRHADSADDVAAMARFVERHPRGAFALHATGADGARIVKTTARTGADTAQHAVVLASGKGRHGQAWLRAGGYRGLMRPHPLVGLAKGVWKGHMQELAMRMAAVFDPHAWWLLPAAAAWVFLELAWLARRVGRWRRRDGCQGAAGREPVAAPA